MRRIAVIGGGYAGMAAAVTLAEQSIPVTVFEAGRVLGGRARRVEHNGVVLDNGLHVLLGAYRETLRLIALVHPNPQDAITRLRLDWHVAGRLRLRARKLPAPFDLLVGLACANGISVSDRLSALRLVAKYSLSNPVNEPDIDVETLLSRHNQSPALRRLLWRPLCAAALNTPSNIASARLFLNVLRDGLAAGGSASDIVFSRCDLTSLFPEPAALWAEHRGTRVLREERVIAISKAADGFLVSTAEEQSRFSHVICALPPHQISRMLDRFLELRDVLNQVAALSYQPIYSVWLQYAQAVRLPGPMIGIDDDMVHWVFDREAMCGQPGLLAAVISAQGPHQHLTHDELAAHAHELLCHRFSPAFGPSSAPLWHLVIAEKRATFAAVPNVSRPSQITPLRNLLLAGDYTASDYPATLEAAVRSGISCAMHIIENS